LKHSCLEYGNIFVVAFTVAVIWEDQMSYFIGVKINIGPYVKWIKKKSENLDLIEHELYDLKSLQPTLSLKIPKGHKSKYDIQYNNQKYKQWSIKHHTEN
jgi:hypothetical protein